ncbi:hypothetical protein [uncultured Pseudokineococcus sp.]|uniref:hypothetical protein n=1 Tax=uncultured Pseudokineococcus sp. TaxID=1642928 RepID=UPI002609FB58|nr:hypothetical protein [uncultured Pseudokineococcus sp.]
MGLVKNAVLLGAGYVVGAHAGRDRYEQIKSGAARLRHRPEVEQAAGRAEDAIRHRLPGSDKGKGKGQDQSKGKDQDPAVEAGAPSDQNRTRRPWRRHRPTASSPPTPAAAAPEAATTTRPSPPPVAQGDPTTDGDAR